jgi:hypothetical protein
MNLRWPWVSRLAYETVADERDRLREKNDELMAHIVRMDRLEHGVGEVPRGPKKPREPMPRRLMRHLKSFDNSAMAHELIEQCVGRHRTGESWESIESDMLPKESGDGP